jgi:hypothetical protein
MGAPPLSFKAGINTSDYKAQLKAMETDAASSGKKIATSVFRAGQSVSQTGGNSYANQMRSSFAAFATEQEKQEDKSASKKRKNISQLAAEEDAKAQEYWKKEDERTERNTQKRAQGYRLAFGIGVVLGERLVNLATEYNQRLESIDRAQGGLNVQSQRTVRDWQQQAVAARTVTDQAHLQQKAFEDIQGVQEEMRTTPFRQQGLLGIWDDLLASTGNKTSGDQIIEGLGNRMKTMENLAASSAKVAKQRQEFLTDAGSQDDPFQVGLIRMRIKELQEENKTLDVNNVKQRNRYLRNQGEIDSLQQSEQSPFQRVQREREYQESVVRGRDRIKMLEEDILKLEERREGMQYDQSEEVKNQIQAKRLLIAQEERQNEIQRTGIEFQQATEARGAFSNSIAGRINRSGALRRLGGGIQSSMADVMNTDLPLEERLSRLSALRGEAMSIAMEQQSRNFELGMMGPNQRRELFRTQFHQEREFRRQQRVNGYVDENGVFHPPTRAGQEARSFSTQLGASRGDLEISAGSINALSQSILNGISQLVLK